MSVTIHYFNSNISYSYDLQEFVTTFLEIFAQKPKFNFIGRNILFLRHLLIACELIIYLYKSFWQKQYVPVNLIIVIKLVWNLFYPHYNSYKKVIIEIIKHLQYKLVYYGYVLGPRSEERDLGHMKNMS